MIIGASSRRLAFAALMLSPLCFVGSASAQAGGGAQPVRAEIAPPAEVGPPMVDHHQHLLSPEGAAMINAPKAVAPVEVPPEISVLLERRVATSANPDQLSTLYEDDALLMLAGSRLGWVRGAREIASYQLARSMGRFRVTPVRFQSENDTAFLAGYYTRLSEAGEPTGYFGLVHLSLRRNAGLGWRIVTESNGFRTSPGARPITADDMIKMLDEAGIRRAVVLSGAFTFGSRFFDFERYRQSPTELYERVRAENDWTAEQVARYPDRLVAFCSFDPIADHAVDELNRCATSGRFAGIKLHLDENGVDLSNPAHIQRLVTIFQSIDRRRLPIVIHVGNMRQNARANTQAFVSHVLPAAPNVPIQIAHLWGGGVFSQEALDVYSEAVAFGNPVMRNVHFDVAETALNQPPANLVPIAEAIRKLGVHRMLYGSDGALPGHQRPAEAWSNFKKVMPLTDAELRIIGSNVAPYLRDAERR